MEKRLFKDINKTKWGDGPWQEEFDGYYWYDDVTGYYCAIVRGPVGSFNGFVGLPPGHPYYGFPASSNEMQSIDIHGGVVANFEVPLNDMGKTYVVLRDNQPATVWYVGFDCAHAGDYSPMMAATIRSFESKDTYCDKDYLIREVNSLAVQLARMEPEVIAINKMKNEIGL